LRASWWFVIFGYFSLISNYLSWVAQPEDSEKVRAAKTWAQNIDKAIAGLLGISMGGAVIWAVMVSLLGLWNPFIGFLALYLCGGLVWLTLWWVRKIQAPERPVDRSV
jgi:hypothetical protein